MRIGMSESDSAGRDAAGDDTAESPRTEQNHKGCGSSPQQTRAADGSDGTDASAESHDVIEPTSGIEATRQGASYPGAVELAAVAAVSVDDSKATHLLDR